MAGLDALGHEHRPIVRNASLDDNPQNCGGTARPAASTAASARR